MSTPLASFMGIPSELRIKIFHYLLPWKDIKYECKPTSSERPENMLSVFREMTTKLDREGIMLSSFPTSEVWEIPFFAIFRINGQCNSEAFQTLQTLYKRTLTIGINNSEFHDFCNWRNHYPVSLMDPDTNPKTYDKPYFWFWNRVWVPRFSALRTLELTISPRNTPGYWYAIQSSMTTFIDNHLSNPPKNLIIKLFDMSRSPYDPLTHSLPYPSERVRWETIPATFGDYIETLQVFQYVALKVEHCQVFLPYWMEHKFQATRLKKVWEASSGVEVRFMPLGTWTNPTEYLTTLDTKISLPKLAYQTPVDEVPQNERSWSELAWSLDKEAPEEDFNKSRVREGYFFLADLAEDA